MGRNGPCDRRGWMGSERWAFLMVHDGVNCGTMGMGYLVARPRKLCLAVGVDDSIQRPGRITSRIRDGDDPFSRRAGSLLIRILDFVFLRPIQAGP